MSRVTDIRYVGYGVADFDAEKAFYEEVWGLDPVPSDDGMAYFRAPGHEEHHVAESTLALVLNALGDSLLGSPIAEAFGLPRDTARELAADRLRQRLAADHPHG